MHWECFSLEQSRLDIVLEPDAEGANVAAVRLCRSPSALAVRRLPLPFLGPRVAAERDPQPLPHTEKADTAQKTCPGGGGSLLKAVSAGSDGGKGSR